MPRRQDGDKVLINILGGDVDHAMMAARKITQLHKIS